MFPSPDPDALEAVNDIDPEDLPRFGRAVCDRDPPRIDDLRTAAADALDEIEEIAALALGLEVGITAGSRGIHDMPAVLRALVDELERQRAGSFVFAAMGAMAA